MTAHTAQKLLIAKLESPKNSEQRKIFRGSRRSIRCIAKSQAFSAA
jgi:hypothetical protein